MKKQIAVVFMSICISMTGTAGVYGADFSSGTETSSGDLTAAANEIAAHAEAKAQAYQERKAEVEKAAVEYRASEIQKQTTEIRKKAVKAARKKKKEEAVKAERKRKAKRQSVVNFAVRFIGNPYVWGGTSLTNGTDCSGFTMSVLAHFGYNIPRTAAAQYEASNKKDISQMEAGDLVFYGAGGISHVGLYIGNGKIVHASTSASGIKISDYNYETPVGIGSYME